MQVVLAVVPPLVAVVLLLARVRPSRAAAAALLTAVVIATLAFDVPAPQMMAAGCRILPTAAEVVLIIFGGVLLSELLAATGAQSTVSYWLQDLCRSRSRALLLVVLGVTPFAESVTGFGVGVVVAVPLLRHLGFPRCHTAVIALLGLVVVPWGALAPGTLVAAHLAGVPFHDLGVRSALVSLPVFVVAAGAALLLGVDWRRFLAAVPELLCVAGALWASIYAVNRSLGTPLAGALGSLAGIVTSLALILVRDRVRLRFSGAVGRALLPYVGLVAGLLLSRTIVVVVTAGATAWCATALTSPATWLLVTCAATPSLLRSPGAHRQALPSATAHSWPVAVTTVLFLLLGVLMTASGMSSALARAAGQLGPGYLPLAPWIGGLGGFVTGSNTSANAMFAASQAAAAHTLGYDTLTLVALQNVSASLLTMASAGRIALVVSLLSRPVPPPAAPAPPPLPGVGAGAPDARVPVETSPVDAAPSPEPVNPGPVFRTVLAADVAVLSTLSLCAVLLT